MTELTQTTLRGILAQVLSVDKKYIVPKQGNFYNPQETASRPDTWCAYQIVKNKPVTAPYYQDIDGVNYCCTQKIATINLQFVGGQSEEIAQSVALWTLRSDVKAAFATVQGALLYAGAEAVSSVYAQNGANTITAWNTSIDILWVSCMATSQIALKTIDIGGQINV